MAKTQYRYNPKSLDYEVVEVTWSDRLLKWGGYLIAGAIFAGITIVIAYNFFPSPTEKKQERRIKQLLSQYEMLENRMNQIEDVAADLQVRDDNIYRVVFEAEPIPENVRKGGIGGVNRYQELLRLEDGDLIAQTSQRMDSIAKSLYIQSISFDEVIRMAREKEEMLSHIPAIQPISGDDLRHIASGFGYRIHPVYKTQKLHTGIDFSAPTGTPIYASGDGVVEIAEHKGNGYGIYVVINHGYKYKTLYGHMSKVECKKGQKVKRGDLIGRVGSTGTSIAPHLHYEVIKGGQKIDPINFFFNDLTPEEYAEMRRISSSASQSFD